MSRASSRARAGHPRRRAAALAGLAALTAAAAPLSASPDSVDLELRRLPLPGPLAMRAADDDDPTGDLGTADPDAGTTDPDPGTADPDASPTAPADRTRSGEPPAEPAVATSDRGAAGDWFVRRGPRGGRDELAPAHLSEKVIFRFNLGFGIDGGERADQLTTAGLVLPADEFSSLRVYGFGDAVVGTRGIVSPSLGSYFAAQFRFDSPIGSRAGAIPTVWDANDTGVDIRHAYGEARDLFEAPLLRPIAIRAGRQFRYGTAIAHFDGVSVTYDTPALSLGLFSGTRATGLGRDHGDSSSGITGFDVQLDLQKLRGVPLVLQVNGLSFGGRRNLETSIGIRPDRDLSLRGSIRSLDDRLAMEKLVMHARLSDVTIVSADLVHRHESDWLYDYALPSQNAATLGDARRYLDLGPVVPRITVAVRAGTVLLDNVDVLLRGVAAFDIAAADRGEPETSFGDGYVEGGAAFEVRVRRAIALGGSGTVRSYDRRTVPERGDVSDVPDPLPELPAGGELSFFEGGGTIRYSPGARRFSATAEIYARSSRYESPWAELPVRTTHGGGRFTVEGWASNRFRLRAEYDVSTVLDQAPELHGLKSLRLLAEGSF